MLTLDDLRSLVAELLDSAPPADDDLIGLGLDSLRLMRVAGRIRRDGLDIGFADLAREPSIGAWARLLAEGSADVPATGPATEPAPAVADGDPFPLALMQHAYWVGRGGSQALGSVAAHLYTEFDGAGVDPGRLEKALAALADRHLMLRARFGDDGLQRISAWHTDPLPVLDLRDAGPDEVRRQTDALRARMSHQLLDVAAGRVIDVRVTLLPEGRTRLHVDVDMLAADARSYRTLLADLVHLYEHPDDELPALGYQYAQYLADRRAHPPRDQDITWWRERLPDLPGAPDLPTRPEHERTAPDRVVRLHHWLDPDSRARLTSEARRHAVTPAAAVAAVFAETLGAWSGTPRFLLNVPMFDRRPLHPDVDRLVGDFTGSVLLDADLRESMTFAERALAVQRGMHEAAAHGSYSGVEVLRDLTRENGFAVLAPVVFTSALDLGELFGTDVERVFGEPVHIVSQGPQVVLDAQVTELHDGLLVNWDVRRDAFPDDVAEAMFDAFASLLARVADGGAWDRAVADLLPDGQRVRRDEVNRTDGPLPRHPLHHAFFTRAEAAPDAVAVAATEGPVTYGELADQALRTAAALRARGVAPGDAVAIRLPKGPGQIAAVLGVLAAGGHYVPIGIEQPPTRVDRIRARANITAVLAESSDDGALPLAEAVTRPERLDAPVFAAPDAIAYVLFTSGSTGEPKGVEVSHRAAGNTVDDLAERLGLGSDDRTLALSALDFDLSVFDIFGAFAGGGAVVTVDEQTRKDASAWSGLVRTHRVTVVNCVPSLLDMLLVAGERDGLGDTLRAVLLGGDWVGVDLPVRLHTQVPGCRFLGLGGTTETAIHSTIQEVRGGVVPPGWTSVPYGTPLRNVRCRVVDAQGRDCPDWVSGELWIGGTGVADAYRGDPERSADRFVERDGLRWYRTGDRARYLPDGGLEFLGRADDQIKIRGFRIELGEVEAAFADHPAVRHAFALVVRTGPAPRLGAVVVCDEDAAQSDLLAHAAERLPAHMLPDHLTLTRELPLTANGKVDRRALKLLAEATSSSSAYTEPKTALGRLVAHVWAEVLRTERVGLHDDYFQLGGDSVLATVITGRLREALDTDEVTVHDMLSSLTVGRLCDALVDRETEPGRLEQVAEISLRIARMSADELDAMLGSSEPASSEGAGPRHG